MTSVVGETGCRLTTLAQLRPAKAPAVAEPPDTARVKGDARMADVVARAVAGRQRPLRQEIGVPFGAANLRLTRKATAAIVERAVAAEGTHNARRPMVEQLLVATLHQRHLAAVERARRAGMPARDPADLTSFSPEIRRVAAYREAVERIWPRLTPERLLHDLFGSPGLLRAATEGVLTEEERDALARPRSASVGEVEWSEADAALLDEAATLLGPARRERTKPAAASEDASWLVDRIVDDMKANGQIPDPTMERTVRHRLQEAAVAGEGHVAPAPKETYGHIIVDEAQDVSPMEWRMLARRCPALSMTIVGDLGQASGHWAPRAWDDVLAILSPASAAVVELTVNYRTPAEVMALAARVLEAESPELTPAMSVREAGEAPRVVRVAAPDTIPDVIVSETERLAVVAADGKVGVVVPDSLMDEVAPAFEQAAPEWSAGGADVLEAPVAVLTLDRAKGLEFDAVVVVEPARLVREHPHGLRALYIALTRTTTWLTIVHAEDLPAPL